MNEAMRGEEWDVVVINWGTVCMREGEKRAREEKRWE